MLDSGAGMMRATANADIAPSAAAARRSSCCADVVDRGCRSSARSPNIDSARATSNVAKAPSAQGVSSPVKTLSPSHPVAMPTPA